MLATVEVAKILQTGLCPHKLPPAPYLLVVDDERLLADTLAVIFRANGYAVTVAYDAASAIEIAELAPPQLLITDFGLPDMNGVELALRVQELTAECNVILVTGMPDTAAPFLDVTAAHLSGSHFPLFTKPVDPGELVKAVSELLPWAGQRKLPRSAPE